MKNGFLFFSFKNSTNALHICAYISVTGLIYLNLKFAAKQEEASLICFPQITSRKFTKITQI